MGRRGYYVYTAVTGVLKLALLVSLVVWLLPRWQVHFPVWGIVTLFLAFAVYEVVTFRLGKRALERKPAVSSSLLVGSSGTAATPLAPGGYVRVNGELWRATCRDETVSRGDGVVVVGSDRMHLFVVPAPGDGGSGEDERPCA